MNIKKLLIFLLDAVIVISFALAILFPLLKRAYSAEVQQDVCEKPSEVTKDKCRDLALVQSMKTNQILTIQLAAKNLNELTQQENELIATIKQLEGKEKK